MKKLYIGRIKLSKSDSEEWSGNPPFMYVTKDVDRTDINKATLFQDKKNCKKELIDSFKFHRHLPSSKMEIMTLSVKVDNIEEL